MRRIEALTGPAGVELFRERTEALREIADRLRTPEAEVVRAVERVEAQLRELKKKPGAAAADAARRPTSWSAAPRRSRGLQVVCAPAEVADAERAAGASPTPCASGSATPPWCWAPWPTEA